MSVILVFKNPALLSRRPHISTIISCVGSWSIPAECSFLAAQFSPIVNTEPEEHTTDVPKRELPSTIGDSPFGVCKEHIRHPRDSDVVLSSTAPPCLHPRSHRGSEFGAEGGLRFALHGPRVPGFRFEVTIRCPRGGGGVPSNIVTTARASRSP